MAHEVEERPTLPYPRDLFAPEVEAGDHVGFLYWFLFPEG